MRDIYAAECFLLLVAVFMAYAWQVRIAAQERSPVYERWRGDDRNGDGRVSRDEFSGQPPMFDRLDRNGDGFITEDELPKGGAPRQVPSTGKEVTFPSSDGLVVYGILWKPEGDGPFPGIVLVHGGVHGRTQSNAGDGLVREGYVVLGVDYRGSLGHGDEFAQNVSLGDMEVDDVVAGAKYLQALPYVLPDRIGIKGGSHGGYITVCAIQRTDIFRAAVDVNGFVDLKRQYEHEKEHAPNFMGIWQLARKVTPEEDPKLYQDRSPLFSADKTRAPLLILQGEHDPLVLPEQSKLLAEELKRHGKEFEFHLIKGTPQTAGHGFSGDAAAEANRLSGEWFGRYLKAKGKNAE